MTSRSPICSAVSARPWVSTKPIDHVDALLLEPVPLAEHGVGLADAGRRAEVDLQPSPRLAADQVEELLGGRAGGFGDGSWPSARERSIPGLGRIQGQVELQDVDPREARR